MCVDNVYEATRRRPLMGTVAPPRHDAAALRPGLDQSRRAAALRKDRAYAVDAAVVRVMKARRTLPQHDLRFQAWSRTCCARWSTPRPTKMSWRAWSRLSSRST